MGRHAAEYVAAVPPAVRGALDLCSAETERNVVALGGWLRWSAIGIAAAIMAALLVLVAVAAALTQVLGAPLAALLSSFVAAGASWVCVRRARTSRHRVGYPESRRILFQIAAALYAAPASPTASEENPS